MRVDSIYGAVCDQLAIIIMWLKLATVSVPYTLSRSVTSYHKYQVEERPYYLRGNKLYYK